MINTVWFDVASVSPAFPSRYTTSPLQSRLSSALWASEGEGSCPILPSHLGGAIAFQDPNPSPRFLAPVRAARSLAQKCIVLGPRVEQAGAITVLLLTGRISTRRVQVQ